MIKVSWDVEELVALIDVYRKSVGKTNEQIEFDLMNLSKALIVRAQRLGIEHDEKYRNLNGMKMMFQNVVYVATNGQQGMSAASTAMKKVYEMQNTSPCVRRSERSPRPAKLSSGSAEIEQWDRPD